MKLAFFLKKTSVVAVMALLLAVFITLPTAAKEINDKAGTTAFSFLKLGVGAKAVAMAGAYSAVADDPSAIHYNPAGTAYLEKRQILAGYHNYVLDIQSGFIAHTRPFMEKYTVGVFINYLNFGNFTRTNSSGEPIGEFSGGDFLFGANFSTKIYPNIAAGINIKYMHEAADGFGSDAIAADLGGLMKLHDSLTTVAIAIHNLGAVISGYTDHKDDLPMSLRIGISHSARELPIIVAIDGVLPNDNDPYANFGVEFYKFEPLYLRAGYSLFGENYKTGSSTDGWGGFSAGFGLDVRDYHISYAFMPYMDLGSSHRITISGEF
jgi:hypothetical protein